MTWAGTAAPTPAEQRRLRDALGQYATGVTVITTTNRGKPAGLTVNSFTSLSLNPPMVLWCLNRNSTARPAFTAARHFAVNILAAAQQDLAVRFASSGDRFGGIAVRAGPHGLPILEGTVATIVCQREQVLPGGDHLVLYGAVQEYLASAGQPLLFFQGGYQAAPHRLVTADAAGWA